MKSSRVPEDFRKFKNKNFLILSVLHISIKQLSLIRFHGNLSPRPGLFIIFLKIIFCN